MIHNRVELLAPAGSFEAMIAAIQGGADAIYFGVEQLNMRARATMNFVVEDLHAIAHLCKQHKVRTYLTLNTIIYDHDIPMMKHIVNEVKRTGIDAIIAADQAVISYAFSQGVEVHISTQANITNVETVSFYAHFADVMVLSRELSLNQIKQICKAIEKQQIKGPLGKLIDIEVFAHGALCMAVSGKCHLSLHTQNASANRGVCVQNCRRKYKVIDIEDGHELEIDNEYIMSAKDLCTIDFMDQLLDTGIKVLKIEGRGKAADYVKTVTRCYREAIDSYYENTYTPEKIAGWMGRLHNVYNRGFWSGYYLGREIGEWANSAGSQAHTRKIYIGKATNYYSRTGIAEFLLEAYSLKVGQQVMITGPTTGVIETTIETLHVNDDGAKEMAEKGEYCSFKTGTQVRNSDKLYKIVPAKDQQ